jgi:hypothetical protein
MLQRRSPLLNILPGVTGFWGNNARPFNHGACRSAAPMPPLPERRGLALGQGRRRTRTTGDTTPAQASPVFVGSCAGF